MKHKRAFFVSHAIPLVLIISLSTVFFTLYRGEQKSLIEHYYDHMYSSAQEHVDHISLTLDTPFTLLESFAGGPIFSQSAKIDNAKIALRMKELMRSSTIDKMFFLLEDGRKLSYDGKLSDYCSASYNEIISSEGRHVLKTHDGLSADDDSFLLSVPVYKNADLIGALVAVYSTKHFSDIVHPHELRGHVSAEHCIVDANGRVLIKSELGSSSAYISDNIFDFYSDGSFADGYTADSLKALMSAGRSVSTSFDVGGDPAKRTFIYIAPITINNFHIDSWYIIESTPIAMLRDDMAGTVGFIFSSLVIAFIGIAIIMFLLRQQRKKEQERIEMLEYIPASILVFSLFKNDCKIERLNDNSFNMLEIKPEDLKYIQADSVLANLIEACSKEIKEHKEELLFGLTRDMQVKLKLKSGEKWFRVSLNGRGTDNWQTLIYAVIVNISHEKRQQLDISHRAEHDIMTELYNRATFMDKCTSLLESDDEGSACLIMIDIDNLKDINDSYGHAAGDEAIISVSNAIHQTFRGADIAGRLGGDEFAVMLTNVSSKEMLDPIVSRLFGAVKDKLLSNNIGLSISVGISFCDIGALPLDKLLAQADMALYHVKQNGRGTFAYYEDINKEQAT